MAFAVFAARRLASMIWVMLFVALFVFSLLYLAPGDAATVIAGEDTSPEDVERIRKGLGLDQPFHQQFLIWLGNILQGDFGISIFSNIPVLELIGQRLDPTISLTLTTIIFSTLVAVPFGVIAAWRSGSLIDRSLMLFSAICFAMPAFVLGYCLILLLSLQLDLFPVQGFVPISDGIGPFLLAITLPTLMLGTVYIVLIARITRATVMDVLNEDYIRTARSRGLSEREVLIRHALPNAAVPIVTVIGLGFALIIGGVVITETVFNIPGIGRLTVDAINKRDYPLIQGIIILTSAVYVIINTIIDILYVYIDPRIRL